MDKDEEKQVDQDEVLKLALQAGIRLQMQSTLGTPIDRIVCSLGQLIRFASSVAAAVAAKGAPQEPFWFLAKYVGEGCEKRDWFSTGKVDWSRVKDHVAMALYAAPVEQAPHEAQPASGAVDAIPPLPAPTAEAWGNSQDPRFDAYSADQMRERDEMWLAKIAGLSVPQHCDDQAVDDFSKLMKEKLRYSREVKGRSGWNDPQQCTVEFLNQLLLDHIDKGDPVDVANFCMMLRHYGARIQTAPQPTPANEQFEREQYTRWAEIFYRHADTFTQRDHVIGWNAWLKRAALQEKP